MPDIITAAEQDAIAAFFAAGGTVTKCPPRYAEPVTGAAPMTDGVASAVREKTPREKWSEAAEKAKKARKIKAEECKRKANSFEKKRERARANAELINLRQKEAVDRKLGAILRFIAGERTWPKLREAASSLGYKTPKHIARFLRAHGHGDKIPPRDYVRKQGAIKAERKQKPPQKPKRDKMVRYSIIAADYSAGLTLKEIREKHGCGDDTIFRAIKACDMPRRHRKFWQYDDATRAGILADYDGMMSIPDIIAKWHVADDTIKRIAAEAGRGKRPRVVKKTAHIYAARLAERDNQIRADYEANVTLAEMCVRWGMGKKAIFESAIRAGAKKRKPLPRRPAPSAKDMQIAAMYQAGSEPSDICKTINTTPRTVIRALVRCKVPLRDSQMRTREQNKREAAERAARAIELHQQGKTNAEIAQIVGYLNESTPRKIIAAWRKNQQQSLSMEAAE